MASDENFKIRPLYNCGIHRVDRGVGGPGGAALELLGPDSDTQSPFAVFVLW